MVAKQLSFLANADSAGLVLGAKVPVILPRRQPALPHRQLCGGDAGRACPPAAARARGVKGRRWVPVCSS
jgi:hypothetical protein